MFTLLLYSPAMADYNFVVDRKGLFESPLFLIVILVGAVIAIGVMSDR